MRCGCCWRILRHHQRNVAADLRAIVARRPRDQDLRFGEQQRAETIGLDLQALNSRSAAAPRSWPRARACASSRIAATTEKPSSASAVVSTANSWWLRSRMFVELCGSSIRRHGPGWPRPASAPSVTRPLRTSDVHDSSVRRIDTITPDIVRPKPHNFTPGVYAAVRESNDNIPFGSRPVRVQTVNAKLRREKCGIKLDRRDFTKMNPLFTRD